MSVDSECRVAELAAYHVGLFAGAAARIDASPAAVAHALFKLCEEAKWRREQRLLETERDRQ